MTKYLVIDTETTGLFDFSIPADGFGQPRMASAALIYMDRPDHIEAVASHCIRPEGWTVAEYTERSRAKGEKAAVDVNGLTDEVLNANGIPVGQVLDLYADAVADGYVVAAFNAQFDTKVFRAEFRRAGRDDLFDQTPNVCMMKAMTPIMGKRPNLARACEYIGHVNEAPHGALHDAQAAAAILTYLDSVGRLPEAKVHYAKNKPAA